MEVTAAIRVVNGVDSREVHDQVFVSGELTEDTYDWYAQDGTGAVWYLGEDSKELDHGTVTSTQGSWEWGKDGALPGIVMPADPASQVGIGYRQEYEKGVAEDWGRVMKLDQSVTVPFGSFTGCIVTDDWNALESGLEHKTYCPNSGVVLERPPTKSELVDRRTVALGSAAVWHHETARWVFSQHLVTGLPTNSLNRLSSHCRPQDVWPLPLLTDRAPNPV